MQSSQDGQCYNLSDGWLFHGLIPPAWDSLLNPLVRPIFVKMAHPFFQHSPQVILPKDKLSHVWPRFPGGRTGLMYFWMVRLLTRMPSLRSSPRILSAPQSVGHGHALDQFDDFTAERLGADASSPHGHFTKPPETLVLSGSP